MASVVLSSASIAGGGNPTLFANELVLGNNSGGTSMLANGVAYFRQDVRVQGQVFTKGMSVTYDQFDPQGPSSSATPAGALFPFVLGQDHTWGPTLIPGTYGWSSAAGTPGRSKITVPAADPSSIILCQRKGTVGSPAGTLSVVAQTTVDVDVGRKC